MVLSCTDGAGLWDQILWIESRGKDAAIVLSENLDSEKKFMIRDADYFPSLVLHFDGS